MINKIARNIALIFILLVLVSCGNSNKPAGKTGESKNAVTMKGFTLVQTISGNKKLEIKAEEAQIFPKEKIIKFNVVKAKYFDKGKEISDLKSNEGLIYTDTNDMEISGNVVLITQDKSKLETEKLKWADKAGKLITDKFVKVTKGDNIMTGIGMESDMMLENVLIKKVTTKISDLDSLKEEQPKNKDK